MQDKLLKGLIEEMVSPAAVPITDILIGKRDVNEFLIAKKMKLTINQVRNILYKLSAEGLVSFIRKKDRRKGWYIYFWTLNSEKCLQKLSESLQKKKDNLKQLLQSRESKRYYICKNCHIEVTEETALEHGFTCEECAEPYELSDNIKPIEEIKIKITKKERELREVNGELEIIFAATAKKNIKDAKKAAKKKKDLRDEARSNRKKADKKANKKFGGKANKKSNKNQKSGEKIKSKKKKTHR